MKRWLPHHVIKVITAIWLIGLFAFCLMAAIPRQKKRPWAQAEERGRSHQNSNS